MKVWSLAGSTALVTLCAQVPAFADVTPAQVWQSGQDLSASYGQTLTAGNVDDQGDTLTVSWVDSKGDKRTESHKSIDVDTIAVCLHLF